MTREEAMQELAEWITQMIEHGVPNYSTRYRALKLAIEALQTEPVVRCKDCKNAGRKMGTHYHCEQQMSWHEEEYFCSFGERREP